MNVLIKKYSSIEVLYIKYKLTSFSQVFLNLSRPIRLLFIFNLIALYDEQISFLGFYSAIDSFNND